MRAFSSAVARAVSPPTAQLAHRGLSAGRIMRSMRPSQWVNGDSDIDDTAWKELNLSFQANLNGSRELFLPMKFLVEAAV